MRGCRGWLMQAARLPLAAEAANNYFLIFANKELRALLNKNLHSTKQLNNLTWIQKTIFHFLEIKNDMLSLKIFQKFDKIMFQIFWNKEFDNTFFFIQCSIKHEMFKASQRCY
jgi:hypothetical protein